MSGGVLLTINDFLVKNLNFMSVRLMIIGNNHCRVYRKKDIWLTGA